MASITKDIKIRVATIDDHKSICQIARQSKYTKAFSNMIFSGQDCYAMGRIRIALHKAAIVGFTCFRHRKRNPATVLYFIGIDNQHQRLGIGTKLLVDLWGVSIGVIEFKVARDNLSAAKFYKHHNFVVIKKEEDYWTFSAQQKTPVGNTGVGEGGLD